MFGKLTKGLRYLTAPAVLAVAGFFGTAEQAEAAKIDLEKGTVTVEAKDTLSKIVRSLSKQGVKTTPQAFQEANPGKIKDVDVIHPGWVLSIPKTEKKVADVAAPAVGLTTSPIPQPRPVETAIAPAPASLEEKQHKVKKDERLCDFVEEENKSFDDIVSINPSLKGPDYKLAEGQILDLAGVGTLNKKEDKHYIDVCTGSGPIAHKPVAQSAAASHALSAAPPVSGALVTPRCELVQSGNRLYSIPLSKKFEESCGCASQPFSTAKVVMENGKIVIKTVWGNPDNLCEKDDNERVVVEPPVVEPPPVDPPDGGCEEDCDGDGDGEDPNDDLDGDDEEHDGDGNTPPDSEDNDAVEDDDATVEEGHVETGTDRPTEETTEPEHTEPETGTGAESHSEERARDGNASLDTTSTYSVVKVAGSTPRFHIA